MNEEDHLLAGVRIPRDVSRRLIAGYQGAPIPAEATEIELRIPTIWLERLGWRRERPEMALVLDPDAIRITPVYPQKDGERE